MADSTPKPPDMRMPLLVSDLDGTLFNSQKAVTARTVRTLNAYLGRGGLFTVATARTPFGCRGYLSGIDLHVPAIVMNGAALYSFSAGRFEHAFPIPPAATRRVLDEVAAAGAGAFAYSVVDGRLEIGYCRPEDLEWTQYNSAAAHDGGVPFYLLDEAGLARLGASTVIYVAVVGEPGQLARVQSRAEAIPECRAIPYRNVYTETDCLEIASAQAGKENALSVLRGMVSATSVVVFGDNHNDIGMMAAADVSYAPANAVAAAREAADQVVPSNDADGVAATIEAYYLGA